MVLQIKLKPFQAIMIYLMGISDFFFCICSRGLGKSFMAAAGALIKMLLYPYSEVVITASTVAQANIIVEEKIKGELIKKLSPYLFDLYEKDYLKITKPDEGYKIECTLNGSVLLVLPCLESSRGHRSTFTIYEECRLLKKSMIDQVFDKMAHPRQAKYLTNPLYGKNPRWLEECKYVYITSARYKFEWYFSQFKKCVVGHYNDKHMLYNVFAGDIYTAIANGLKTKGDLRRAQKMSSEMDFRMEDLNEVIGEAEDAFFTIESFKNSQVLPKCWRPPTAVDILVGRKSNFSKKKAGEIRILAIDLSFAGANNSTKNDNTIFLCGSLTWSGYRFERHIDYIEAKPGGDNLKSALRTKELYWDYDADYIALD